MVRGAVGQSQRMHAYGAWRVKMLMTRWVAVPRTRCSAGAPQPGQMRLLRRGGRATYLTFVRMTPTATPAIAPMKIWPTAVQKFRS
jgi:hypothetical protein